MSLQDMYLRAYKWFSGKSPRTKNIYEQKEKLEYDKAYWQARVDAAADKAKADAIRDVNEIKDKKPGGWLASTFGGLMDMGANANKNMEHMFDEGNGGDNQAPQRARKTHHKKRKSKTVDEREYHNPIADMYRESMF